MNGNCSTPHPLQKACGSCRTWRSGGGGGGVRWGVGLSVALVGAGMGGGTWLSPKQWRRWGRCSCHRGLCSPQVEVPPWKRKLREASCRRSPRSSLSLLQSFPLLHPRSLVLLPFPISLPSVGRAVSPPPTLQNLLEESTPCWFDVTTMRLTWTRGPALPLDVGTQLTGQRLP